MTKNKLFKIGQITIEDGMRPLVIAEMSGNHNHSLERALKIVDAAADTGCDGIKLQTYSPDTMTLPLKSKDFVISDSKSPWYGQALYDLYRQAMTPWEWHEPIIEHCKKRGLLYFSTPFDETAVDFLKQFDMPAYKIASFENTDIRLIRKVAATGKPLIISTGMASLGDLENAYNHTLDAGSCGVIFLKCTSNYPASNSDCNLATITHLRSLFNSPIGISDHTLGIGASIASVVLGAVLIEKHMTLSRADGGVDAGFSMEPEEMKNLVYEIRQAWLSIGKISYGSLPSEEGSRKFRRSLYVAKDMCKGDVFTTANLRTIRPGYGLSPQYYDIFLGQKTVKDIAAGTPVSWDLLKEQV